MNLLIIGGSDAGISAALGARAVNPALHPTIVLADAYPNFSICGIPFYLSGEVDNWQSLAHRDLAQIEAMGITVLKEHKCTGINPAGKSITVQTPARERKIMAYDKLVLCTGARSTAPKMEGLDLPGIFHLRWMDDCLAMKQYMEANKPDSIIIVGAGYIGMEMADAMTRRGLAVTVLEYAPTVLTTLDADMAEHVLHALETGGVRVFTGTAAKKIEKRKNRLIVHVQRKGEETFEIEGDMVLVATGSRPEAEPGLSAGIETGAAGAIKVNSRMETSLVGVYAAGDCTETRHRILNRNVWLPLGTTAHKQGKIAGENAAGENNEFSGSLGTQCVKIFDRVAARTGLKDSEAAAEGFSPLSIDIQVPDHKVYYPGADDLHIRMTGDRITGRLLGAQIVGPHGAEISKRIDIVATALHHFMLVAGLCDLDLSYTPPLSSPWDPIQMAATEWENVRRQQ